jgi:hypothetical protein
MKKVYEFPNKTFTNRKPSFTIEPFFCWHNKANAKWKTGLFYIYHKPSRIQMSVCYTAEEAEQWCNNHKDIVVNKEEYEIIDPIAKEKLEENKQKSVKFPLVEELQQIHNNIIKETKNGME